MSRKRKVKAKPPPRKRKPQSRKPRSLKSDRSKWYTREQLAKRKRKPTPEPVVTQEPDTIAITSPEIVRARVDVLESELASLRDCLVQALQEHTITTPTADAHDAELLRDIGKRLTSYLDDEHLEACRIMGCTPLFYVLELIDIKKIAIFQHPKWVLLPKPKNTPEEKFDECPS